MWLGLSNTFFFSIFSQSLVRSLFQVWSITFYHSPKAFHHMCCSWVCVTCSVIVLLLSVLLDDFIEYSCSVLIKSMSFSFIVCFVLIVVAVEVKKEPEPPTETVKQEEREPATKSSAPAPPSKPPPEKRARLQWHSSHTPGRWQRQKSPKARTKSVWLPFSSAQWNSLQDTKSKWPKKGLAVVVSVPGSQSWSPDRFGIISGSCTLNRG